MDCHHYHCFNYFYLSLSRWYLGLVANSFGNHTFNERVFVLIFSGLFATFLYNYFASLLRSVGNSLGPLYFLSIASIVNVGFDMVFVMGFKMGVNGAAMATIIA